MPPFEPHHTAAPATAEATPSWPFDPLLLKAFIQGPMHSCFQATLDSQRIVAEATVKEMETLEAARHRLGQGYEQLMACQKISDLPGAYAAIATAFTTAAAAQTRLAAETADRLSGCCAQLASPARDRKGH